MERKSDIVREAVANGDYKKALGIARNFRFGISKEDADSMRRGYECMIWPEFYKSIGKDVTVETRKGIDTVIRLYSE